MAGMQRVLVVVAAVSAALVVAGCEHEGTSTPRPSNGQAGAGTASAALAGPTAAELKRVIAALEPLHARLGTPQEGDWLARFKEAGQTFDQYVACEPVTPNGERRTIQIQPLGAFTERQRQIVERTADFMGRFFSRPVTICDDLSLEVIPESARRENPFTGQQQILTTYVLDHVLRPRLADDAAACIAFTASDLWPGEGWNYVFGQASLRERVGVWSLARNGDPAGGEAALRTCLRRTIKTAVHETGHMFSMQHCTAWSCVMCGSNSLAESDRQPLALCPECLAKVCWATGADPVRRYRSLGAFCKDAGLERERLFYERSISTLVAVGLDRDGGTAPLSEGSQHP